MKIISILMLLVLTCCNSLSKHKDDIKNLGHDIVDEEVDKVDEIKKERDQK